MKGRKSPEIAKFLEKRFNDTVSRFCHWWQEGVWAGYGWGMTGEPSWLSQLGKAAQNLLLPSWSMVLLGETSAHGSPGNTSEQNMSADAHKNHREKMRRSSSALISCSSNFSNSKGVRMNGTSTRPEFCFPCHVALLGEVALGEGHFCCHPAWGQQKAAPCLPDLGAESFLELFPKFTPLLYWFYQLLPEMVRVWQKGRCWKRVPLSPGAYSRAGAGSSGKQDVLVQGMGTAVWTWEVWKEQTPTLIKPAHSLSYGGFLSFSLYTLKNNNNNKKVLWWLILPKHKQAVAVPLRRTREWVFSPVQGELGLLASSLFIDWFIYLNDCSWLTGEGSVQSISELCHVQCA